MNTYQTLRYGMLLVRVDMREGKARAVAERVMAGAVVENTHLDPGIYKL